MLDKPIILCIAARFRVSCARPLNQHRLGCASTASASHATIFVTILTMIHILYIIVSHRCVVTRHLNALIDILPAVIAHVPRSQLQGDCTKLEGCQKPVSHCDHAM